MEASEKAQVAVIREKIATDTSYALHALRIVWARQKPEERFTGKHMGHDGKGFRRGETVMMNELHDRLEAQGWKISGFQADMVRERMRPYARQLWLDSRERGVDPISRGPGKEGTRRGRAKINKHAPRPKLTQAQRERMWRNIERWANEHDG